MGEHQRGRASVASSPVLFSLVFALIGGCHGEGPAASHGGAHATSQSGAAPPPSLPTAQPSSPPAPVALVEEHFTGRTMSITEAKNTAKDIVVGEVLDPGQESPDAPGQIFHERARLRVVKTLSGSLAPNKELIFSYTRQILPASDAESPLTTGGQFMFFLVPRDAGAYRAIKILRATEANIRQASP